MNYEKACSILELNHCAFETCKGVNKNEITIEILKKQYKLKALQYHPDKNNSPDASEKFQEINNSYQYLLKHLEFIESDDEDDDDFNDNEQEPKSGYRWVLYKFLKNILSTPRDNSLFYKIIQKISTSCEKKALETLEKIDKKILIKIYEIINSYKEAFHFSSDFFNKVELIIKKKIEGDECIILHPTIDDLFENNLYKLKINGEIYIIPLWHHELIYDNSGNDIYVKCFPIIDDSIYIDNNNNIHLDVKYPISSIWDKEIITIMIGKREFKIKVSSLKLTATQSIIFKDEGISKINTIDIYDITKQADIIINIQLSI
jgi:DnaJ-class molecular chaperone